MSHDQFDQADLDAAGVLLASMPTEQQVAVRGALVAAFAMGLRHGIDYAHNPAQRYVNPYRSCVIERT